MGKNPGRRAAPKGARPQRRGDEGGALAFALIAMTAALAIAASAMYVALGSQRISTRSMHAKNAFFCAELALERARPIIAANWGDRNTALAGGNPAWYTGAPLNDPDPHTLTLCPGPGGYYYAITIQDDADEFGATVNNPLVDTNDRLVVHAEVFAPVSNTLQARVSALITRNLPPMKGYP